MQGTSIPRRRTILASLALTSVVIGGELPGSRASAQSIQTLLTGGDTVPGVPGTLSTVRDVFVADSGQWVVQGTMLVAGGATDVAILNGAAVLIEGDALFDPPGVLVEGFDEIAISTDGTLWWNINTDASMSSDEVLYRNLVKLAQEGSAVFDPNQPVGTIWKDIDGFNLADNGDLLVLGDMDNPNISGGSEGVLVLQTFDDNGFLATETVLIIEGDPIPGIFDDVRDVGTNSAANDVALANGHWIAYVRNDGSSSGDEMVLVDGAVVAQEGKSGPLPGTTWKRMNSNAVDIRNDGSYAFRAEYFEIVTGTLFKAIFVDALPVIQSGDTSDSLAPFAFEDFGANPVIRLAENGNLVFYGRTDNTDNSKDTGYFLNDRFLIQEGVTQVNGQVITNIPSGANSLEASPNGRYVIAQGTQGDSNTTIMLIDLGNVQVMSSSTTNRATLAHEDGIPVINETLVLQMDGEQDIGVTPFLMVSDAPIAGWSTTGSGLVTPFGELLIDLTASAGNPGIVLMGPPSDFSPVDFTIDVPNNPSLAGTEFYAQGFYWDIGDASPQENFRLTNGLQISIGE